jgi:hypothetical protein
MEKPKWYFKLLGWLFGNGQKSKNMSINCLVKYSLVGGVVLGLTTLFLYAGVSLGINLFILNTFNFLFGFVIKYLLYDVLGVFSDKPKVRLNFGLLLHILILPFIALLYFAVWLRAKITGDSLEVI